MAGGIGDKKVDVTWATEEAGLLLGISVKCITSRDRRTGNFQKNLTNRRGDMLIEAVTLHRRFPYAVLVGLMLFDKDAEKDDTSRRRPTFLNAHRGLRLFTGRRDPAGRDEQLELFYIGLVDATRTGAVLRLTRAGMPDEEVTIDDVIHDALAVIEERNFDSYEVSSDGNLTRRSAVR